jgi:hypothetical protein
MMKTTKSGQLAFGGMSAALSVLLLLLTAIVPVSEMGLPAVAGVVLIPVVLELGRKPGLTVYAAVSLLALFLVGSWESKLLYIAFFGYYPILKAVIESRCGRVVEWILKLLVFNAAAITTYWALFTFFSLDPAEFTIGGVSLPWVFLLLGNGVFLLYDIGLTRLISTYVQLWSPRLRRLFRF